MEQPTIDEGTIRELVAKAQDGDSEAFETIYTHFFQSVFRFVAFRIPREAAEDVVADIFVQAWEKLHAYKVHKDVPFGAWLFRIARHKVIDTYRAHREWEEVPDDAEDLDRLNRADTAVHDKDLLRIVRAAMDKLPKRYREVLHLSFIGELPYSEVARVLRMREGTVRILKFRALRKLETLLPPHIRDFDQK